MAISRSREAALASIRLATLAQAIKRTRPTAAKRSMSFGRVSPTTESSRGTTLVFAAQMSGIRQGKSGSSRGCRRRSSACADAAGYAVFEAAEATQVIAVPGVGGVSAFECNRDDEPRVGIGEMDPGWHDADDAAGDAVYANCLADCVAALSRIAHANSRS